MQGPAERKGQNEAKVHKTEEPQRQGGPGHQDLHEVQQRVPGEGEFQLELQAAYLSL